MGNLQIFRRNISELLLVKLAVTFPEFFILKSVWGCSYENTFPVVFSLDLEKIYYSLKFIYEIFPQLREIYLREVLGGKILQETNVQNG